MSILVILAQATLLLSRAPKMFSGSRVPPLIGSDSETSSAEPRRGGSMRTPIGSPSVSTHSSMPPLIGSISVTSSAEPGRGGSIASSIDSESEISSAESRRPHELGRATLARSHVAFLSYFSLMLQRAFLWWARSIGLLMP